MLMLLQNTPSARQAPARALAVLKRVVAEAPIIKTKRGEAAQAAARILRQAEQLQDGSISESEVSQHGTKESTKKASAGPVESLGR